MFEEQLYYYCEEYHKDIRKSLAINYKPSQMARILLKRLNEKQLEQIISETKYIVTARGSAEHYFITVTRPILESESKK